MKVFIVKQKRIAAEGVLLPSPPLDAGTRCVFVCVCVCVCIYLIAHNRASRPCNLLIVCVRIY